MNDFHDLKKQEEELNLTKIIPFNRKRPVTGKMKKPIEEMDRFISSNFIYIYNKFFFYRNFREFWNVES